MTPSGSPCRGRGAECGSPCGGRGAERIFTIGMRGIHDSSMEGYTTLQEKFDGLQQVIDDQQELLRRYVGDPSTLMQTFVPYKEVLELYEMGLRVPDYATLLWCDDNYGYMTRYSSAAEQRRSGGAGIYYHLSYWGRPHDYLWLTTTQPGLICLELHEAYRRHVRKLWIANVHDPKVASYDLELFLDLAWNINSVTPSTLCDHYNRWLCRQFGTEAGTRLFPAMHEFFRLCAQRRPEFMGWTQVELDKKRRSGTLSRDDDGAEPSRSGRADGCLRAHQGHCMGEPGLRAPRAERCFLRRHHLSGVRRSCHDAEDRGR